MKTTFRHKENTTEVHAYDSMNIKNLLEEFGEHSFEAVKKNGVIIELHAENLGGFDLAFSEKY